MSARLRLVNAFQRSKESAASQFTLPERLRGGRIERWAGFWRSLFSDYADAVKEVSVSSKKRPVRATLAASLAASALYMNKNNPDERSFRQAFTEYSQQLALVPSAIMNPDSARREEQVRKSLNEGVLKRANLGLFSLMWRDNFPSELGNYQARCKYLEVGYLEFFERVVDVGFLGRWWLLESRLRDCDINPAEWNEDGSPKDPNLQLQKMW